MPAIMIANRFFYFDLQFQPKITWTSQKTPEFRKNAIMVSSSEIISAMLLLLLLWLLCLLLLCWCCVVVLCCCCVVVVLLLFCCCCCVLLLWLWLLLCVVVVCCFVGIWCGTLEKTVCRIKTAPCVRSKRPRVCRHHAHMLKHMCARCLYTRRRFDSTHGVEGGRRGRGGGVTVSSAYRNLPT